MLAAVLAEAVRTDRLPAADAMRVIRHELRRRNTNKKLTIPPRSLAAQAVIDKYEAVPKNSSPEALHADHVYSLKVQDLQDHVGVEAWQTALGRLREVVCVTAKENADSWSYLSWQVQTAPTKYEKAEIEWA